MIQVDLYQLQAVQIQYYFYQEVELIEANLVLRLWIIIRLAQVEENL